MVFDRRETALLVIGDFLILIASLWAALFVRVLHVPSWQYFETNLIPFLPLFFLSLLIFYIAGLYEKQTRPIHRVMGARIAGAQAATVTISAVLFFALPLSIAPKTILLLYLVISVIAESAWRFYRSDRELASGVRTRALLVGSGSAADELFEEINGNGRYLIRFSSRIQTEGLTPEQISQAVIDIAAIDARIVVIDTVDPKVQMGVASFYGRRDSDARLLEFAALYEEVFDRVPLAHQSAHELLESVSGRHIFYDGAKRVFDTVLAALLSVVALPFVVLAALLLSLEGGSSPFITALRIGRDGRTFRMIKLRSMLFDDKGDAVLHKDNRVTPIGQFLRKSRIDELPQLWNVLMGDVSFIGPRPELPKIAEVYEREIPQYSMRYLLSPGLSGWAQIHDYDPPKGGADVERTKRKLSYDLYYLKHRSFGLDLAIAIKTIRALLSFSGT